MEHYSAIKKDELLLFVTSIEMEGLVPIKISQKEKNKYLMVLFFTLFLKI